LARASAKTVVERCWILLGSRQGAFWHARCKRPTRGKPASVAFDAAWVLEREERHADVVGFYHTHPDGPPTPSDRDLRTMRAWVSSFGKPLLCLIESDGKLAAYRFDDDRSRGELLAACELIRRRLVVAYDPPTETSQ
jgi:proteasome lid subunit RPN8/RPN11